MSHPKTRAKGRGLPHRAKPMARKSKYLAGTDQPVRAERRWEFHWRAPLHGAEEFFAAVDRGGPWLCELHQSNQIHDLLLGCRVSLDVALSHAQRRMPR